MQKIFFCGYMGGSGKTTLALNLARYLHYYEKRKVCLLGFDLPPVYELINTQTPFPFSCKELPLSKASSYLHALEEDAGTVIVDCPSFVSKEYLDILPLADFFVIPHEYTLIHYYKLKAFLLTLRKAGIEHPSIFLLPNRISRPDRKIKQLFADLTGGNIVVLPYIGNSAFLAQLSASSYLPNEFQLVRACFSQILTKSKKIFI